MGRHGGRVALVVLVVVCGGLAACGVDEMPISAAPAAGDAAAELVYLSADGGVTAARLETGERVYSAPGGVVSGDRSRVFTASPGADGSSTRVDALDAATGERMWGLVAPGLLEVRTVSQTGAAVALLPARAEHGDAYQPEPRATTELTVVATDGSEPVRYVLDGNYEPEAFTVDGSTLYVIEYLPPLAPDRYRVRQLDVATGAVDGVYSLDKHLQEAMGGTARVQALAPDGRRLYTMYTVEQPAGSAAPAAFVHVLSLDEGWAHCVDLPAPMGTSPEEAHALAVTPDGGRLLVTDAASGMVAEVDTAALTVARTGTLDATATARGVPALAAADGERLYVGAGQAVHVVELSSLERAAVWPLDEPVTAVQRRERHLLVVTGAELRLLDALTGDLVHEVALDAGGGGVGGLDPGLPSLEGRDTLQCAC